MKDDLFFWKWMTICFIVIFMLEWWAECDAQLLMFTGLSFLISAAANDILRAISRTKELKG